MIKGGIGGSKTLTGLKFEERTNLRETFQKLEGYEIKDNCLYFNEKLVAKFFKKYRLYSEFLKGVIDWKTKLSKRLLPDEAIFVLNTKTLFVIEMKTQHGSGSVDEKLQTCDFKLKQYTRLLGDMGITVRYIYLLDNWFKQEAYKDTMNYIKAVGCEYYFEELPLSVLGLSDVQQ